MPKFVLNFKIKPAATKRRTVSRPESTAKRKVSKLCLAVVVEDEGTYKARVQNPKDDNEHFVIPFTPDSLDLKGKTHIYRLYKDKYNHWIMHIRNKWDAQFHPGLPTQYQVVHEGCVVAGFVIKENGHLYFQYESLYSNKEGAQPLPDAPVVKTSNKLDE